MKKPIVIGTDKDLLQALSNSELAANHLYLYAANCALNRNLLGFVSFFDKEAKDEIKHYKRLREAANQCGVELDMEETPEIEFKGNTIEAALNGAYEAELALMKQYEKAADKVENGGLKMLFMEFCQIQLEAVGSIADLLAEIESQGDNGISFMNQRLQA